MRFQIKMKLQPSVGRIMHVFSSYVVCDLIKIMMDHWYLVIHHSMSRREMASAILTDCGLAAILIEVVRRWSPPPPPHFSVSWSARHGRRVATGRCFGGGCRAPSWRTAGPRRWRPSGPDGAPRRWLPPLPRCCWCCSGSHLLEKNIYIHTPNRDRYTLVSTVQKTLHIT